MRIGIVLSIILFLTFAGVSYFNQKERFHEKEINLQQDIKKQAEKIKESQQEDTIREYFQNLPKTGPNGKGF